mgnify:CR=1 FL=1
MRQICLIVERSGLSSGLSGAFPNVEGNMRERNHEGYHDPTACRAVKRADRRRKSAGEKYLTYPLGEAQGFQKAVRELIIRS